VTDGLRAHGRVFDEVAAEYDEFRRGYPAELVDVAVRRGALTAGSRVLEVGCGTGKLTERLVGRGLRIDAVDPGAAMLEMARRRVGSSGDVAFHVATFEEVELPEEAFDALFSATAFHWVDPSVGWAKAARVLRPRGLLALLANTVVATGRGREADHEFQALLQRHVPELAAEWQPTHDRATLEAGLLERRNNISRLWDWGNYGRFELAIEEAANLFEEVEVEIVVTDVEQTGDEFLAGFRTTSLYLRLPPERRGAFDRDARRLVERLGGTLDVGLATVLVTARRA
jgi:SAM-dependent methyltransferase